MPKAMCTGPPEQKSAHQDQRGNPAFAEDKDQPTLGHAQARPPAPLQACASDRKPPLEPAAKRRGLRSGSAPYACVRREGGRGRASA